MRHANHTSRPAPSRMLLTSSRTSPMMWPTCRCVCEGWGRARCLCGTCRGRVWSAAQRVGHQTCGHRTYVRRIEMGRIGRAGKPCQPCADECPHSAAKGGHCERAHQPADAAEKGGHHVSGRAQRLRDQADDAAWQRERLARSSQGACVAPLHTRPPSRVPSSSLTFTLTLASLMSASPAA